MKISTEEALSMIDDRFLKVFSEELVKVFGDDIFSMSGDDESEYIIGPPVLYLEGTFGWSDSFKRACMKTGMRKLSAWYRGLDWRESDEFDGELAEKLVCFNTQNSNAIEEIRAKIDSLSSELGDREEVEA